MFKHDVLGTHSSRYHDANIVPSSLLVDGLANAPLKPDGIELPGQVRSECLTCTFRQSCCSARLSRAQVTAIAGSSVRDSGKKVGVMGEGGGGWVTACTGGYNSYLTSLIYIGVIETSAN